MPPRIANSPCSSAGSSRREAGVDEQLGEIGRGDVLARLELERRAEQPIGRADPRQQRRGRRDDDARGAGRRCACSARARADVTPKCGARPRYGSTSCDGNGRTARSAADADSPSSAAEEERHVGDRLLEIAVARHDVQHDAVRQLVGGAGDEQRLGGRRQPGDRAGGHVHAAAGDGGLQQGAKVE